MLSFLGIGNAFNYKEGNCSAFYKKNNKMLLIDCGETTFNQIIKYNLLDDIDVLEILITHFHSDHIGSLGTLLFYADKLNIRNVKVAFPNLNDLQTILDLFGVQNCNYNILLPEELNNHKVESFKQNHDIMEAYGYLLNVNNNVIYYSGDTRTMNNRALEMLKSGQIDYFYQDTAVSKNNYHFSLEELEKAIPFKDRCRVYCMHIGIEQDKSEIEKRGFSLVKQYKGDE